MKLEISHTTKYDYANLAAYGLQQVRLTPLDNPIQKIVDWELELIGCIEQCVYQDHHGNDTRLMAMEEGSSTIEITARGIVETAESSGILGKYYNRVPLWHYQSATRRTEAGAEIAKLAGKFSVGDDVVSMLHDLSAQVLERVPYRGGVTDAQTSAEQALRLGHGVCQDHAQIFIACARHLGMPARYVSGYLMMNDRVDQDASHGWAEVYLDTLGWVGFDISNGYSPDERYVRIAVGLDSREAAPITGMRMGYAGTGPADESMIVSVQVQQ